MGQGDGHREISDQWPINRAVLVQIVGPKAVQAMLDFLPDFFEASTPQVERLQQAADRLDGREMALLAHTLRGSSANLAMLSLKKMCVTVEQHCKAGRLDQAAAQVHELVAEYTLVRQACQKLPYANG
jgi:HPt (histidine-containing phosphotransfer) domain-containing protein